MVINEVMEQSLNQVQAKYPELDALASEQDNSSERLATSLVQLYRNTEDLETRQSIMVFMQEAGYAWLRKLFVRNEERELSEITSTVH